MFRELVLRRPAARGHADQAVRLGRSQRFEKERDFITTVVSNPSSRIFGNPYLASALSGILLVISFPKPHWHLFVWIACAPLLAAIVTEARPGSGFLCGYICGAIFLTGSCYWFVDVLKRYGGLGSLLAIGAMVAFVVVFAAFFGAFGLLEGWIACRSHLLALVASPFLWISMELARTHLITGFPWNLLGYAVNAGGLRQLASATGVYGLSFLAATTSALLAWVFLKGGSRIKLELALWSALLIFGNLSLRPPSVREAPSVAVLVQPDVPLGAAAQESWAPWRDPAPLNQLVAMTVNALKKGGEPSATPPLLIWSENSAPFYFHRDPVFRTAVQTMARETQAYAVIGTVTFADSNNTRPKNSAIVLDPQGKVAFQYDKIHLVPFGEYIPWWAFAGEVGKITSEAGDFVPGSNYSAAQTREGAIGILICYEAIFPGLVRRLVPKGPGVLVNISNDAWYGDSSAAPQHLEMARLRAVENHRFLLRATNDGVTAVIDPYGRIAQRLPRHCGMALHGRFAYLGERTFYTAHGDVFAWLCFSIAALMMALAGRHGVKRREASGGKAWK